MNAIPNKRAINWDIYILEELRGQSKMTWQRWMSPSLDKYNSSTNTR